jgi:hypothetical protein
VRCPDIPPVLRPGFSFQHPAQWHPDWRAGKLVQGLPLVTRVLIGEKRDAIVEPLSVIHCFQSFGALL